MKPPRLRFRRLAGVAILLAGVCPAVTLAGATFPDNMPSTPHEQAAPPPRDVPAPSTAAAPSKVVAPSTPLSREEIEADIHALEEERENLLAKYSSAHPDVRSVERRLQVRRKQLEELRQAESKK